MLRDVHLYITHTGTPQHNCLSSHVACITRWKAGHFPSRKCNENRWFVSRTQNITSHALYQSNGYKKQAQLKGKLEFHMEQFSSFKMQPKLVWTRRSGNVVTATGLSPASITSCVSPEWWVSPQTDNIGQCRSEHVQWWFKGLVQNKEFSFIVAFQILNPLVSAVRNFDKIFLMLMRLQVLQFIK
jgi:hypothetical protein